MPIGLEKVSMHAKEQSPLHSLPSNCKLDKYRKMKKGHPGQNKHKSITIFTKSQTIELLCKVLP